MGKKRIHLSVAPALLARLDELAKKYGLDRSGAASYCFSRVCADEGISTPKVGRRPPAKSAS